MRPVQLIEKPNMAPGVCLKCGSGPTYREHFVDLGIDSVLDRIDEHGARHLTDGVVYLCNECMSGLISDYLRKLFGFINAQKTSKENLSNQDAQARIIQAQEIDHLRKQLIKLEDELREAKAEAVFNPPIEETKEVSARDQLTELFPEDNEDGTDNGSDESVSTEGSDDSVAAGTIEDNDGDSAAAESIVASDLFDLKAGKLITPANS